MTIKRYSATLAGQTAAFAVPNPKNVAFENSGFTVRTGADYEAPLSDIPDSVTQRQARIALLRAGLMPTVTAALAALPGQAGDEARIAWEYAQEIRRTDPLVSALAGALSLDSTALDTLFKTAAAL